MNIREMCHRRDSVILENIEIEKGGKLRLKLFAYPVKTTAYFGRLAFVVFYDYETSKGSYSNFTKSSKTQPRFIVSSDYNITALTKDGQLKLLIANTKYQEIRSRILQQAVLNSANRYSLDQSRDNIKWFTEHRSQFSTKSIGANDYSRDRKRLPTVLKQIPANEFKETNFVEIAESFKNKKIISSEKTNLPRKGSSPGLRKFLKMHAVA